VFGIDVRGYIRLLRRADDEVAVVPQRAAAIPLNANFALFSEAGLQDQPPTVVVSVDPTRAVPVTTGGLVFLIDANDRASA
jgi:hypothetical protein